jgi:hypothetical protein
VLGGGEGGGGGWSGNLGGVGEVPDGGQTLDLCEGMYGPLSGQVRGVRRGEWGREVRVCGEDSLVWS